MAIGAAGEGDEDGDHDRGGAGDHPGGALQPVGDRLLVRGPGLVALAHPRQQEDRVVDREAEDDPEDAGGADRVDVVVAAQRPAGGNVEEQGEDAEGDGDREQVERDRDRRQGSARRTRTRTRKVARVIATITSGTREEIASL